MMKGAKSKAEAKDTKLSVKKGAGTLTCPRDLPVLSSSSWRSSGNNRRKNTLETNLLLATVAKVGGGKWKSMSDDERTPYVAKADKRKADYEINMEAYNRKPAQGTNAVEEDGSEVDEEDGSGEEEEDD